MRFSLRTLVILLTVMPALLAGLFYAATTIWRAWPILRSSPMTMLLVSLFFVSQFLVWTAIGSIGYRREGRD